jgi:hypothetical protein
VRDLLEEQLTETARVRRQRQLIGTLGGLNYKLKLDKDSREAFEGEGRVEARLVAQRNAVLLELDIIERSRADELLGEVEGWADLYAQEGDALTAYRPYRMESGDGYALYVEQEVEGGKALVGGARAMVVVNSFDDRLARRVIGEWCGVPGIAEEQGGMPEERHGVERSAEEGEEAPEGEADEEGGADEEEAAEEGVGSGE